MLCWRNSELVKLYYILNPPENDPVSLFDFQVPKFQNVKKENKLIAGELLADKVIKINDWIETTWVIVFLAFWLA